MRLRARSVFALSLAATGVACNLGSFSLGAGPDREDSLVTGGAAGSGSSSGGDGGASGGAAGSSGADAGGTGATGGGPTGSFGVLMRVSRPDLEGDLESRSASITWDGRFIVYESDATNLVQGDTNQAADIFLFDRLTGSTGRISTEADGTQANDASLDPAISGDGSRIVFSTWATNLDSSLFSGMVMTGRESDLTAYPYDLTPIAYPDGSSSTSSVALTSDGSSVVFLSADSHLTPDDANQRMDFFVYDTATSETQRVRILGDMPDLSFDSGRPDVSSTGYYLGFSGNYGTARRNIYRIVVSGDDAGLADTIGVNPDGAPSSGDCYDPSFSANGHIVAFVCDADDIVEGDTNGVADVFVRDLSTSITRRVSVASDGTQAQGPSSTPALSGDGRRVVFQTNASNLGAGPELTTAYGALVSHNRVTGETWRFTNGTDSGADGPFEDLTLTFDGQFLVFESNATRLLGDAARTKHVYLYQFLGI